MAADVPRLRSTIVGALLPGDPATLVRPLAPADASFCRALFDQDRGAQLAPLGDAALVRTLLDQQYRAQQIGYARACPNAEHAVIEHAGVPVGRLIVAVTGDAVHLVDIVLAVAARGCGIGTDVIGRLARTASARGAARLTLSVLQANERARRLYARLGFVAVATGSHVAMVKLLP
ncbi:GNAT family N-acetyltransferase [Rhodoplanes roseus]|uniref:GNAT family N-acetyltransferase n=1 Tax=Rhodoplanes roseus TaxID=29409 RepID=UPI001474647B|nr:GNAT family N-acetyltransferase [Rhodoplanes roseus]